MIYDTNLHSNSAYIFFLKFSSRSCKSLSAAASAAGAATLAMGAACLVATAVLGVSTNYTTMLIIARKDVLMAGTYLLCQANANLVEHLVHNSIGLSLFIFVVHHIVH